MSHEIPYKGTRWKHRGGGLYRVVACGRLEHEGEDGEICVVYRAFEDDEDAPCWIRSLAAWHEVAILPDSTRSPRFVRAD